jgi:hypothetical protein
VYQQIDGGAWIKLNATATTDLTYTLTPTEPGEYNFRVTSVRGDKESAPSAETLTTETMMQTVYTDTLSPRISAVDGTAFIDGADEEVYASDFSSDLDGWLCAGDDETSTWTHDTDHGVLDVTSAGTSIIHPIIYNLSVTDSAEGYETLEIEYTVNSGVCVLYRIIFGGITDTINETLTGSGTLTLTKQKDTGSTLHKRVTLYFNGTNTFNLSIHSITVTKHPTLAIAQDYTDGNHLLEIEDSAGKALSGVLKTQGNGETVGSELVTGWNNLYFETFTANADGINIDEATETGTNGRAVSQNELTGKQLLFYDFDVTALGGATINSSATFQIGASSNGGQNLETTLVFFGSGAGNYSNYATLNPGAIGLYVGFRTYIATSFSISNFILKQVTSPSTNGATLVNEIFGDTQNLVSVDDGFAYNEASYTCTVNSTQTISGLFSTTGEITVHWGDGTSNTYNGTDQAWSKDYGSAVDELVVIEGSDYITKFTMDQSGADISFDLGHLPINLTSFLCSGSNTVSGSLADLPAGLTYFRCYGSNTVSGSLADLPAGLTYFNCQGSNTIDTYTTRTWTTKPSTFTLVPVSPGGLSETEINQLLVDLDEDLDWTTGTITLIGTNAAPTGAGLIAVNNMRSEGATVTVNS